MGRKLRFWLAVEAKAVLATAVLFFCFHTMNDGPKVFSDPIEWQRCAACSGLMGVVVLVMFTWGRP